MNGGLIKSCELFARVRSGRVVKAGSNGIVLYNAAWFEQHRDTELTAVGIGLKNLSSAQPERKTGHWLITDTYPHNVYCSVCHTRCAQTHWSVWRDGSLPRKFCPHCGSKMEREGNE